MKPKDYRSQLDPVWCSGCGSFGVLKGLSQALSDLAVPVEKLAVISGIGCSSRLPGYMNAYAFNTLHGRALPIATGLKVARSDLTTLVIGGDGDGFSIGLGHIPHAVRRNVDMTYVVIDNGLYGLTKGQASPTTDESVREQFGQGTVDDKPLNPVLLVLASGCNFVARTHAGNLPHVRQVMREAIAHRGFSFVHVLAGCITYQPGGYAEELYRRSFVLPEDYVPSDYAAAADLARQDRFALGVLYRKESDAGDLSPATA